MFETLDLLLTATVLGAITLHLIGQKLSLTWRAIGFLSIFIISLLPYPYGLGGFVLSYISGFSITAGVIAMVTIESSLSGRCRTSKKQLHTLYWLISIAALAFYPSSLGAFDFDAYGFGYGSLSLSLVLLTIGLIAWFKRFYLLCSILILAQIAFAMELLISDNLWDYLLDPCLVVFAMYRVIKSLFCKEKALAPARG